MKKSFSQRFSVLKLFSKLFFFEIWKFGTRWYHENISRFCFLANPEKPDKKWWNNLTLWRLTLCPGLKVLGLDLPRLNKKWQKPHLGKYFLCTIYIPEKNSKSYKKKNRKENFTTLCYLNFWNTRGPVLYERPF